MNKNDKLWYISRIPATTKDYYFISVFSVEPTVWTTTLTDDM